MKNNRAIELDRLDRRILERFQHDTALAAAEIGAAIGLSAAAVQRRLKRLREAGVIAAEIAALAPKPLGVGVCAVVMVDLEREGAADLDRFKLRIATHPEVQQCYYVTGQSDFVLVVLAADLETYEAFTRRALLSDPNVKSFTTHVALERVKVGLSVPIALA
jgi:DNA-binding Lrp family transcriptional regulator